METPRPQVLTVPSSGAAANVRPKLPELLFLRFLRNLHGGYLQIEMPGGGTRLVGDGAGPTVSMRIVDRAFFRRVFLGGSIGFGEAYVDGLWDTDALPEVLQLLAQNQRQVGRLARGFSALSAFFNRTYHRRRRNTLKKSRENIREHYDLSNDFYASFLDATMTYSSARFQSGEETLETAQLNKIERMLDLAGVGEGDSILEIGTGWGALAERAALRGCSVKTITLSEAQYRYTRDRLASRNLGGQVEVRLQDYRDLAGEYDAVLSCEMIEAVGHEFLETFFDALRRSVRVGGRVVLQAITIPDGRYRRYCKSCDWIQKHIFPGGHLPSPGVLRSLSRQAGLRIEQMEGFGKDYARTLRRWADRFNAAESRVEGLGFDARFRRKWNYYLAYCEAGFATELIDVKHMVMERSLR